MAPKGRGGKGKGRGKGKQPPGKSNSATVSGSIPAAAGRNFPVVVIFGILSRLPVKSVLRFTCVSKQWRTTVSLSSFISQHLARSPASLLIHALRPPVPVDGGEIQPHQQPSGHAIYSYHAPLPDPESGEQPAAAVDRIVDFPGHDFNELDIIGSTPNGVVCIVQQPYAQSFTLWNPATRSSLRIPDSGARPDPSAIAAASGGFGFDPSCNEYKLIRIIRLVQAAVRLPDVAEVFNFQTGRWGRLDSPTKGMVTFRAETSKCEAVVDGVPYWRAWEHDPETGRPRLKLAWFDAARSDFNVEWFGWEAEKKGMILGEIWEGSLGAIVWNEPVYGSRALSVWMRESLLGAWVQRYRVNNAELPVVGRLIGFYALYGSSGIVQEIVDADNPNGNPYLCNINLDDVAVEDYICLVGSWPGTCAPLLRYRESLARMPRIRSALI